MLLLKNGIIATMDPDHPRAEAAVVDGDCFVFVGSSEEAEALAGAGAQVIDLAGGFVMPGFHDSHMHFIHYVKARQSVDLFGAGSLQELKERMRQGLEHFDGSGGRFLMGEGWNQELFSDEKRFPTCRDLDEITTQYPVIILRTCFHVGVLNSRAMEVLGLNRETAAQYGAFAEVFPDGEPNGVIKESFLDNVKAALPSLTLPQLLDGVLDAQHDLFSEGLISVQSDDFKYAPDEDPYALMEGLMELARSGKLMLRISEQALLPEESDLEEFFRRNAPALRVDDRFHISTVKLLADGSLGARTAYLQAPYADAPDTVGLPIYTQEELNRLVFAAHRQDMPVAIHVIGDAAARMALDAMEYAQTADPAHSPRHGLVHCQIMTEALLKRMAALGVQAYTQPVFIQGDMHIAPARLGQERLNGSYAWNTMKTLGIRQSFGTDCPVERLRPLDGVYCAVTRKDFHGNGPFLPEEALTVEDALRLYTAGSAWAAGEEHIRGTIAPGMLADFILLDRNLLTCPPEELLEAQVLAAWIGGEQVYSAQV